MSASPPLRLFEMGSPIALKEPSKVWWLVCKKCHTLMHSRWTMPIDGDLGLHLMRHEICPSCGAMMQDMRSANPRDLESVGIFQRVMDYNERKTA